MGPKHYCIFKITSHHSTLLIMLLQQMSIRDNGQQREIFLNQTAASKVVVTNFTSKRFQIRYSLPLMENKSSQNQNDMKLEALEIHLFRMP